MYSMYFNLPWEKPMNQNTLNSNLEKWIGFHPSFPSDKFHCLKCLFSVSYHFKCSYQAMRGHVGGIKLSVEEKILEDSIYKPKRTTIFSIS